MMMLKITEDSTKYIDKIVELCNENSIKNSIYENPRTCYLE